MLDDQGEHRDAGAFVGLATVDLGYLVAGYPIEDTKATALDQFTAAGGPATNAAVTFGFLGGQACLATSMGRHWLTRVVREDLEQHGVAVTDLTPDTEGAPPASSIIVAEATASRTIVSLDATRTHAPAPADPRALLGGARIVLVDGHLTEPCAALAETARAAGVPVVFDGGRWRASHKDLLGHVSVAICSNRFDPPDAGGDVHAYLHDLGVQHVAITSGEAPIRWSSASGDTGVIKPPVIRAADTLGAGDIFHGAFSYYFAAGYPFPRALEAASIVAASSCESFGTRSWMVAGREKYAA